MPSGARTTQPVFKDPKEVKVEARGSALWTLALPWVNGPVTIQITVKPGAQWSCGLEKCGPAGTYAMSLEALLPSTPIGALVAKLGGSDADWVAPPSPTGAAVQSPTAPKLFPVGSYCIIDIKADEGGPLFLTMNDRISGFVNHADALDVTVALAV